MGFNLFSIESDPYYFRRYHCNYIYAPIVEYRPNKLWYSAQHLEKELPAVKYDFILINWPRGEGGRENFCHFLHLFKLRVPIMCDIAHSPKEMAMLQIVAKATQRKLQVLPASDNQYLVII